MFTERTANAANVRDVCVYVYTSSVGNNRCVKLYQVSAVMHAGGSPLIKLELSK